VLAFAYDIAGHLRDRAAEALLTVGASAVIVAVLAFLLTGVAPGHFNLG
jgi:hypothetical protein